jgi:ATP-binding cassette subfamily B protein
VEQSPFRRAWGYLNYRDGAKWAALASGFAASVLYIGLLTVLLLFTELLVTRGEIPSYGQLSPARREAFRQAWPQLDPTARRDAVAHVAPATTDWNNLLANDPAALSPAELRTAWDAAVYLQLEQRVGLEAAEAYRAQLTGDDSVRTDLGALSTVERIETQPLGRAAGWLASWNKWSWQPVLGARPNSSYLVGLLLLAVALALVRGVLLFLNSGAAARATLEAATRLRRAIYHHTFRLGTLAIRAFGPGEAVSMFTRHVESVHDALYARLTVLVREPTKFILLVLFALLIDFWLGMTSLLFALLLWVIGGQLAVYFRNRGRAAGRRAAAQLAPLQESLMLMRLVKVYLMELFNQSRVERQLRAYVLAHRERVRGEALFRPLLILLGTLAAIGLLFVAGLVLLRERLDVARLFVLAAALCSLYFPLRAWLDVLKVLRRGRESAAALFEFLDRRGDVSQAVGAEFVQPLDQQLEFRDVSLREPGTGRMLLRGIDLAIPARSKVALVGPDPAEKHAIVYLVPRFLDPTSGEIRFDGQNLRWVTLDSLRAQIAVVLQHNLVFNDSVANNIGCGDPSYTVPQVIEAAKVAHAHNFIQRLPYGYETRVGELGHTLPVGEQFRIALARAILRDPAILIIEEPEGPMDDDTRRLIDDTYDRILPGRTVIFLPARSTTVKRCDRVFLINDGRIEAAGEHRELLSQNDLYKHLHYMQHNPFVEQAG